jgi:guanylate kinase
MSGIVFIISAPSGSGKSTLVNEIRKVVHDLLFSVSYTTRNPRGSEQDGREYRFISRAEFQDMIGRDQFLEHACVFGNYYGTARECLEDSRQQGKDLLLDIDVQGAAQVKQKLPDAVSIFVLPPSKEILEKRLRRRSEVEQGISEETIKRRLETATKEIENYSKYDYILVNDRLEDSIDALKAIVSAERYKRAAVPPSAVDEKMLTTAEQCLRRNVGERVLPILESFSKKPAPAVSEKR